MNGTTAIPWRSSRKRRLSLLEQLKGCQEAWCPGTPWDREKAQTVLCGTPAGSFLVLRDSVTSEPSLLCVSAGKTSKDVLHHKVQHTGSVFQLSESRLSFSDLPQLVLFYSLSRDVLSVCLTVPRWIYSLTEMNKDHLSQLEPETWLSTPPEIQTEETTNMELSNVMCSIQLTSTNGALCIINPLYLRDHGDDWLTHRTTTTQQSNYRRDRRLSTTRAWAGSGLQNKRAVSLEQQPAAVDPESSGLIRAQSAESSSTPTTPTGVVLRRPSRDFPNSFPQRASTGSYSAPPTPGSNTPELHRHSSPVPQSPHRVSWIEDGFWLPPPRPLSLLHPPSLELDSLSISSIEEEQESHIPSPSSHSLPPNRLANKVINRLSAVGQALGGLVSQKKRLTNRVQELSERKGGAFAEAVKGFVELTLKGGTDPSAATGSEFLQEVRSSLTSLKETLLDYPEIQAILDSITDLNDLEIGGYYLTTLYASLYYISSFRPRLAARQLSMEAQNSINQWHRRRTLYCNQARRSKHRRTIRRQSYRDQSSQSSETETGNKTESGRETDSESADVWEQQTGRSSEPLQTMRENTQSDEHKDESQTSDCQPAARQEETTSQQEEDQTVCGAEEEQ
ncbi:ras and Rab interactor 2 [Austrofundulus limnaeus]|uniref:Ras and Rab interactor 2 n=1 Tax=Austrofundulus limnaeus TaxID=52670 RepID=A0A2I4BRQ0_AUSLI|nr:PREDICTED: ras and Rab interactor 2-like [Austrofundulus limnaeus]